MCVPLAAVAIAAMVASTAYTAYSSEQQGKAQSKAIQQTADNNQKIGEYNAEIQDKNAFAAGANATDSLQRGAEAAAEQRQKVIQANATGRANAGSSGLLADSGSILDLQGDNAAQGEMNALTVSNNAQREAYGYKVEQVNDLNQAAGLRFSAAAGMDEASYQAGVARANGTMGAFGALVNGASSAGQMYLSGGFGGKGGGGKGK